MTKDELVATLREAIVPSEDEEAFKHNLLTAGRLLAIGDSLPLTLLLTTVPASINSKTAFLDRCTEAAWDLRNTEGQDLAITVWQIQDLTNTGDIFKERGWLSQEEYDRYVKALWEGAGDRLYDDAAVESLLAYKKLYEDLIVDEDFWIPVTATPFYRHEQVLAGTWRMLRPMCDRCHSALAAKCGRDAQGVFVVCDACGPRCTEKLEVLETIVPDKLRYGPLYKHYPDVDEVTEE